MKPDLPSRLEGDFEKYSRPALARLLASVGLDVEYERAEGDYLFYRDATNELIAVLDFAGGYGGSLLGHNHPAIIDCMRTALDERRPFHAQASIRGAAGRLGARLSSMVSRSTGRDYVVTLSSTGAEAVEAAVKHAEFERFERFTPIVNRLRAFVAEYESAANALELGACAEAPVGYSAIRNVRDLVVVAREQIEVLSKTRPLFLALEHAFHGKTIGALGLTANPRFRDPFGAMLLDVQHLPVDMAALDSMCEANRMSVMEIHFMGSKVHVRWVSLSRIAAFFVEPIQGEGGVTEIDPTFLAHARERATADQFPLVFDEIQCGMGRTGAFLGSELSGVAADYYLLSKTLGGGLAKVAATLVERSRYQSEFGVLHTSTFADDHYGSAVALKVLDLLDAGVIKQSLQQGEKLRSALLEIQRDFPNEVFAVRGRGLMLGVDIGLSERAPSVLLREAQRQGILGALVASYLLHVHRIRVMPTMSAPNTFRVQPSAYVTDTDIARFAEAVRDIAARLRAGEAPPLIAHLTGEPAPAEIYGPSDNEPSGVRAVGTGAPRRKVAFLAHFLEPSDLRYWDRTLYGVSERACEALLDRTRDLLKPMISHRAVVRSLIGSEIDLVIVGVPITSQQVMTSFRSGEAKWIRSYLRQAVDLARCEGASIVGFGAYTSIVTNDCRDLQHEGIQVTSGNGLTAAAAFDRTLAAMDQLGLTHRRIGIVGAMGNLGSVFAELLAPHANEMFLVGRSDKGERRLRRLERQADELRRAYPDLEVSASADMHSLRECNVIISATNSPTPLIGPEHLATTPLIVCDVAAPGDVQPDVPAARPHAMVLKGGLVRLPFGQAIGFEGLRLPPGITYGCLGETLLLGLSPESQNGSVGALTTEHVREAAVLAGRHGFEFVARPVDARDVEGCNWEERNGDRVSIIP